MSIAVKMTDKFTGESRIQWMDLDWNGTYIWDEGNFSCDCNRADFFAQAHNEEESDDSPCGHERFVIDSIFANGVFVYSELEPNVI